MALGGTVRKHRRCVADGLAKGGLDVEGVVSSNRLMPDKFDGAGKPHRIPTNFGDALRIEISLGSGHTRSQGHTRLGLRPTTTL